MSAQFMRIIISRKTTIMTDDLLMQRSIVVNYSDTEKIFPE